MIRGALRRVFAVELIATAILTIVGLALAVFGGSAYSIPALALAVIAYLGVYLYRYGRL